jgi:hypothetical protein
MQEVISLQNPTFQRKGAKDAKSAKKSNSLGSIENPFAAFVSFAPLR